MSNKANKPEMQASASAPSDDATLKRRVEAVAAEEDGPSSDTKRPKSVSEDDQDAPDLASILGIKAGDRLEVKWDIGEETKPNENEQVTTRWWGATLLETDGKVEDGCAIRTLEYDAWPEGGFPDKSREEIIFIGRDTLVDVETQDQMEFRLLSEDNSAVFFVGIDEVESLVNTLLEGALKKAAGSFNTLPRAHQAAIADKIASKKEKLIELLQNYMSDEDSANRVVTAADAHRLLAQAMQEG
jgi:hypothetical protein